MFRAKLQEGFIFRKIVEAIKDVVSECNLQIDRNGKSYVWHWNFLHIKNHLLQFFQKPPNSPFHCLYLPQNISFLNPFLPPGISLQAMDSSHVALASLFLSYEGFDEYVCPVQSFVIGLNIQNLYKVMRLADTSDSIALMVETAALNSLVIQLENPKSQRVIEFQLNLLQLDIESLNIPQTISSVQLEIFSD